jgi:hypothetical protein
MLSKLAYWLFKQRFNIPKEHETESFVTMRRWKPRLINRMGNANKRIAVVSSPHVTNHLKIQRLGVPVKNHILPQKIFAN